MTAPQTTRGFVYLIVNEHFPGWVKVGLAADPDRRLASYQTSDPTRSYRFAHVEPAEDCRHAEWVAHERLKKLGHPYSGEWFRVDVDEARRIIIKAAKTPLPIPLKEPTEVDNTDRRHGDERLPAVPSAG